ncbi:hypothetical protein B0F90DRAFT_1727646, partial [Multifurca ochricompacta]
VIFSFPCILLFLMSRTFVGLRMKKSGKSRGYVAAGYMWLLRLIEDNDQVMKGIEIFEEDETSEVVEEAENSEVRNGFCNGY